MLSNPHLAFNFDPASGRWSLYPQHAETPLLEAVRLGVTFTPQVKGKDPKQEVWPGAITDCQIEPLTQMASANGPLTVLKLAFSPRLSRPLAKGEALRVGLEFALPASAPFLLFRSTLHNPGQVPFVLHSLDLASVGPQFAPRSPWSLNHIVGIHKDHFAAGALRLHASPGALAFFAHGYQSWSFTGALQAHDRQPGSFLGPFGDPQHFNLATPRPRDRGHFTSEMFGLLGDRDHQTAILAGFLSQREQFGVCEVKLDALAPSLRLTAQCDDVILAPGDERVTDWAYLQFVSLDQPDPLRDYLEAVARENQARVPKHTPVGWCSWYHYFEKITETDLNANLDAIVREQDRLPLEFVQLDDGFQPAVGDWFTTNAKFPSGLKVVADKIRAHNQTPGLWLAPYIAWDSSALAREHPDWFLKAPSRWSLNRFANAGLNWFKWTYGLDPTHPEARAHIRRLIHTAVNEWGFPYLKLDFLFAAALPARRHDPTLTRAQAMRQALQDMRDTAGPETFILACGCPLGSAIGLVDGMRISADVAPDWHPQLFHPNFEPLLLREMELPSARNAIRNTLTRASLHRRWWLNDPDCLLVRDHDTRLSDTQIATLATVIALSGGMFLVSDDMTRLHPERQRYIAPLMPVLDTPALPHHLLADTVPTLMTLPLTNATGPWLVVGLFNWDDQPRDLTVDGATLGLEPGDYFVSDFWNGTHARRALTAPLTFTAVPGHGCRLLALRRADSATPAQMVASTFHFSQGAEITAWETSPRVLRFTLTLGHTAEGELRLRLPAPPRTVTVNGAPLAPLPLGDDIYALRFTVKQQAEVIVAG